MKLLPFQPRSSSGSGESSEHLVCRTLLENLDSLYSTAYRLTGRADVAEDVVQETARKALKASPALNNERNVRGWLFTILVNNARDRLRRSDATEDREAQSREPDAGPDLESLSLATAQDVRRALGRLAPAQRAVVQLVDVEEFTIAEAAKMLEIPPGTVASRLGRAHQQLRTWLRAYRSERSQGEGRP